MKKSNIILNTMHLKLTSSVTGSFYAQRASYEESVAM